MKRCTTLTQVFLSVLFVLFFSLSACLNKVNSGEADPTLTDAGNITEIVFNDTGENGQTEIVQKEGVLAAEMTPSLGLTSQPDQFTREANLTGTIPPSPTPTPGLTLSPELPLEHYITNIHGHKQYFSLGCEAGVAVDWARYFGVEINEFEFQYRLPLSDNPDLGFVGGVDGPWGQVPPYSYGVYAAPVANLLQDYGLDAVDVKGFTLAELKAQIAGDKPVIAWVIGNVVGGIPYEYVDINGDRTIVAAYEHVVIVTGYSEEMIRYNNNGKFYDIPTGIFENSWAVLGNMVIYLRKE